MMVLCVPHDLFEIRRLSGCHCSLVTPIVSSQEAIDDRPPQKLIGPVGQHSFVYMTEKYVYSSG